MPSIPFQMEVPYSQKYLEILDKKYILIKIFYSYFVLMAVFSLYLVIKQKKP